MEKWFQDKKNNLKSDTAKRDYERVPLSESIDEYFNREVNLISLILGWIDQRIRWDMKLTSPNISISSLHSEVWKISLKT